MVAAGIAVPGARHEATSRRSAWTAQGPADRAAAEQQARPAGSLRVNAPMAFGALELAAWLPPFLARYPELRIDLVCNDRIVDLIEGGFDVALRLASKLPDSTLIARRLASSGVALVAAPAYLERHGAPRTPQELLAHNCLSYTLAAQPRDWDFTGPDGAAHHVSVQGNLQANTGIASAGWASRPPRHSSSATNWRAASWCGCCPTYAIAPRELYALYPQNRHLSPKVRAFVDFAAELYRTRRWD
ncbi:DNA-binding transcriptional LysR family regulator [Janthinobacterium sp. CG_23.3]|uniref:substrate binding domain-containing protein n=1 Tax=Janthinobacterium sp. CG_23.3 TaxID=3349634 RepID=UPI0038D3BE4C